MKKSIPISSLCFEYRDSILFWVFLFKLNKTKVIRDFILSCPNHKLKKDITKGIVETYPDRLDLMLQKKDSILTFFGRSFFRLLSIKESVKIRGQLRYISVIAKGNKLYPMGGTKRLVSLILLGNRNVKIVIKKESEYKKWKDYSLTSSYFQNVPESIVIEYKKWKQLFIEKDFHYESKPV